VKAFALQSPAVVALYDWQPIVFEATTFFESDSTKPITAMHTRRRFTNYTPNTFLRQGLMLEYRYGGDYFQH
jgi:hypothetical protein